MSVNAIKAGSAFVEISARDQALRQSLEANKARIQSFVQNVSLAGAAAVVAGAAIGIKAASDMEETLNKFNVVFGENQEAVKAWADTFAAEVGRSKRQVADFLASTQDLLVPVGFETGAAEEMSKQVTQLAVDVASFNNKLDSDVMRDFHAALTGGGETVKKYGIVLDVAATKAKLLEAGINPETASNAQKVWARWQIILGATTAAQGDAVRSGDAFANQYKRMQGELEDLAATVGAALLPAMSGLLQIANAVLLPVSTMIAENPKLVTTMVGLAVSIGAVTAAFRVLAAAQAVNISRATVLAALSGPKGWAALAVGLGIAAAATTTLNQSLEKTAQQLAEATNDSNSATEAINRQTVATEKLSNAERERTQRQRQANAQASEYAASIDEITKLQESQATSAERLAAQLEAIAANQRMAGRIERRTGRNAGGLTAEDAEELRNSLIDSATGFGAEVQSIQNQIALLNGSLTETDVKLSQIEAKGLPADKVAELRQQYESLAQQEVSNEQAEAIAAINTEIALLSGSITEADLRLQDFASRGLPQTEVEALRKKFEQLAVAKEKASAEQAQEQRKQSLVADLTEKIKGPELQFNQMIEDFRELIAEGTVTREDAEQYIIDQQTKAANAIAKRNEESARNVRRESSVDLRSAQGSSLIVDLLNGQQNIEERKLTAAEITAKATASLAAQSQNKQVAKI